ncbi:MAG: DUF3108 domain-containing protein [Chloracidobacterium sp.]|nr:DUF3108 domain-containing protein [Chloracidobacterium sp.]
MTSCPITRPSRLLVVPIAFLFAVAIFTGLAVAQSATILTAGQETSFRVGEKLSYSVSYETFQDVAYLETQVLSTGMLGGKRVFEINGRLKTYQIVSAALSLIDENRTVFVAADTGMPLMVKRTKSNVVVPVDTVENFLSSPAMGNDLLSLLYAIRATGGSGSFTLTENGESHAVTVQPTKPEKVKISAGEFDSTVSVINSSFFVLKGIKNVTINLSADDRRLPIMVRFRTSTGTFRVELSNVQYIVPAQPEVRPTPVPAGTTRPAQPPRPQPSPAPYVSNQPLLAELAFNLGEVLEYKLSSAGNAIGIVRFEAKERTLFQNRDSLLLTAIVSGVDQGNKTFGLGDMLSSRVNPETLAPLQSELKFSGVLRPFNQTVTFDPKTGAIQVGGPNTIDAPVGTHSLVSLIYAMRSFNLDPSKSPGNPVNDTRVAVYWMDRPYIFTLRPGNPEMISINGVKLPAQLITVNTGNLQLDQLAIKVWLSTERGRKPLRFSVGTFQADLIIPNIQ